MQSLSAGKRSSFHQRIDHWFYTFRERYFGALLDSVQNEPVTILKNGRPTAVVLSPSEYARMGGAQARILSLMDQMAKEAKASGLTPEILQSIINE